MYIEKVVDSRKYILKSKYIGAGFTAKCFLLKDGRLLKLYHKDSYNKYMIFRRHNNMIDFLCELSKIKNDTFIGPNGILINEQEEVIGYFMDYKRASTLKKIDKHVNIHDIISALPKLEEDTLKISESKYRIFDMHLRNILFNNQFYIIDLDGGNFCDYQINCNCKYNMRDLYLIIIDGIFHNNDSEINLSFYDQNLNSLYENININGNINSLYEFLNYLCEIVKMDNPDIKDLRKSANKVLKREKVPHYYSY